MSPKQRKIAIMGFRSVGKSSLTIQFVEGQFVDSYDPTIENTFTKTVKIRGQEYFLKLVDTAGQDEYSIFPQSYSMDIHGYVLVYSVTSAKSFEVVKVIYEKLLDMTGKVHVPIVLVGNKVDLHMERVISYEEGKKTADDMKAAFLEASAKQNQSVTDIFHTTIMQIEKADGTVQEKSGCMVS
ncbi:GTP-binding protein Rheb homolog isoform X2 [Limulus polyphemus]|uniref:GTP-binding protein Rheb homolog isoform X2 n=1 Tax=Limulus polyphemus TaxID=6850 RepID=A0ABM1BCX8_LIMPO|nr:GTP-binding protein Rheb homolog isoform X2 [Limulus polyphemus]